MRFFFLVLLRFPFLFVSKTNKSDHCLFQDTILYLPHRMCLNFPLDSGTLMMKFP